MLIKDHISFQNMKTIDAIMVFTERVTFKLNSKQKIDSTLVGLSQAFDS